MPETPGRRLRLFQERDHGKHWWALSETRHCGRCGHLFTGNDIRLTEDAEGAIHFHCPTHGCPGTWEDWQYPELHL